MTAEYKRASHAVWEAMAPGWDEQEAGHKSRPQVLELVGRFDA